MKEKKEIMLEELGPFIASNINTITTFGRFDRAVKEVIEEILIEKNILITEVVVVPPTWDVERGDRQPYFWADFDLMEPSLHHTIMRGIAVGDVAPTDSDYLIIKSIKIYLYKIAYQTM